MTVKPLDHLGGRMQDRLAGEVPVVLVRKQNEPCGCPLASKRMKEMVRLAWFASLAVVLHSVNQQHRLIAMNLSR